MRQDATTHWYDGTVAREAIASALYVDLVLLGAFAAVPFGGLPRNFEAVRLILGTSIGLLLAHWLAFRLASRATQGGLWTDEAAREAGAQFLGGALVAVLASLPFLVLDGVTAVRTTAGLLGALLAAVGFVIARRRGFSMLRGSLTATGVLVAASIVVYVKSSGH